MASPLPTPMEVAQHQNQQVLDRVNEKAELQYKKDVKHYESEKAKWDANQLQLYGQNAQPYPGTQPAMPMATTQVTHEDDILLAFRNEITHLLTFDWRRSKSGANAWLEDDDNFKDFLHALLTSVDYQLKLIRGIAQFYDQKYMADRGQGSFPNDPSAGPGPYGHGKPSTNGYPHNSPSNFGRKGDTNYFGPSWGCGDKAPGKYHGWPLFPADDDGLALQLGVKYLQKTYRQKFDEMLEDNVALLPPETSTSDEEKDKELEEAEMSVERVANCRYVVAKMNEMRCPKEWDTITMVMLKKWPLEMTELAKQWFTTLAQIPLTEGTKQPPGPFGGRASTDREATSPVRGETGGFPIAEGAY